MLPIVLILFFIFLGFFFYKFLYKRSSIDDIRLLSAKNRQMQPHLRAILNRKVGFYRRLNAYQKQKFESDIMVFLEFTDIKGKNGMEVTDEDRMLIASGAVIPVFGFKSWRYLHLKEVILYPGNIPFGSDVNGRSMEAVGLVGGGFLHGKMLLSKPALHHGFSNEDDKKNVIIHEFLHLLDKQDGTIDGVPKVLMEHPYIFPWMEMAREEMLKIDKGENEDIRRYGATNRSEFFAVIGEYFFEKPYEFKHNNPKLYKVLSKFFNQRPAG